MTELEARLDELDRLMQASGKLVPESYADKTGQHVGIATVRVLIADRLKELLEQKERVLIDALAQVKREQADREQESFGFQQASCRPVLTEADALADLEGRPRPSKGLT